MAGNQKKTKLQIPEGEPIRQWYAVHTYSGYEEAVARYLKQRV